MANSGIWMQLSDGFWYQFPPKKILEEGSEKAYLDTENCSDAYLLRYGIVRLPHTVPEEDESCTD